MPYMSNPVLLMFTMIVHADHTWQYFSRSKAVDVASLSSINIGTIETASDIQAILHAIQCHKICPGHTDETFVSIKKAQGDIINFVDNSLPVMQVFASTVRSSTCTFVIPVSAVRCIKYRTVLRGHLC